MWIDNLTMSFMLILAWAFGFACLYVGSHLDGWFASYSLWLDRRAERRQRSK